MNFKDGQGIRQELEQQLLPEISEKQIAIAKMLQQARELLSAKNFEEAIICFDRVLEMNPDKNLAYAVWGLRCLPLEKLGRYEEVITSLDKAIKIKPDQYEAWYNQGIVFGILGRYEEAIVSYDKAIEIKPDYYEAWSNRGSAFDNLGRYKEAIVSYDKAIEIKPDYYETWNNRGVALKNLERYKEAITSYDKAIEIKPDYYAAWNNQGVAFDNLERYEEAIASHKKAIEIKHDFHEAWYGQGVVLGKLSRYKEAIISYDRAIEIKSDKHEAWHNRGVALVNLGRYEEAISSYDKALEIKPDKYNAWLMRGTTVDKLFYDYQTTSGQPSIYSLQNPDIDQPGYAGEIANYRQGLEFCQQDTHPEGWGWLYWWTGRAHYRRGKKNRRHLFADAREAYDLSLKTLTVEAFPETHLEVLQDYIKLCWELGEIDNVAEIYRQGTEVLQKLITKFPQKKEYFERKFISFQQVIVDLCIQSGDVAKALVLAEQSKATCLSWMLSTPAPMDWLQIQNLVRADGGAFIYWYYSPLQLHTILLLPQQAPQLIATTPVDFLEKLLTTWNNQYTNYTTKDKTKETRDETWQQELPHHLTRLTEILSIEKILPILNEHNIQNLTLIPHRDLHRLPLHALGFPPQIEIRYLPTLHLTGISPLPPLKRGEMDHEVPLLKGDLGGSSGQERRLLSVEAPDSVYKDTNSAGKEVLIPFESLTYAAIESEYICQSIGEPLHRIADAAATKDQVINALAQGCEIFHFTGHAGYNFNSPKTSALCLSQEDRLTIEELIEIPLDGCQLVCLSACETGITGKQTITDEYVGLVSAFLAQGVGTVVSTIWQIESAASAIIMMEFYRCRQNLDDITALQDTTQWLRAATAQDLITWWKKIKAGGEQLPEIEEIIDSELRMLSKKSRIEGTPPPYSDPYYWAAFTITRG